MEFRLTYAGLLFATQRDPQTGQQAKHVDNKHHIRTVIHEQLKRLWTLPPLSRSDDTPKILVDDEGDLEDFTVDGLAKKHALYGFNFVPLVTHQLDLLCGLDVLLLRPDRPGDVMWAGDIDNRIKTLIDALRIPEASERYTNRQPTPDQTPFYCLLEDDKLITKLSIDTDRLLEPVGTSPSPHDARLIITVRLRPYGFHPITLVFS